MLGSLVVLALSVAFAQDADGDGCSDALASEGVCVDVSSDVGTSSVGAYAYIGPQTTLDGDVIVADFVHLEGSTDGTPRTFAGPIVFGRSTMIGANAEIGSDVIFGRAVTTGAELSVGSGASIGYAVTAGDYVAIGQRATVGNLVDLGNYAVVGDDAVLARNVVISGAEQPEGAAHVHGIVGAQSVIEAGAFVGVGARVRKNGLVESNATIQAGARVGRGVTVERGATVVSGARVASDATIPAGAVVPGDATVRRGDTFTGNGAIEVCDNGIDDDDDALTDCADTTCVDNPLCLNAPPTAGEWAPSPLTPKVFSGDLLCGAVVEPTDANNDLLSTTISWTLNGQPWSGTTSTQYADNDTIPADQLQVAQSWSCSASVSDGLATAVSATSASVTVAPNFTGTVETQVLGTSSPQMDFVGISAGSFTMGCVAGRDDVIGSDCSWVGSRPVTLTHDFWLGQTEVTVEEFRRIGPGGWLGSEANLPMDDMNWNDAAWYANQASERAGLLPCFVCEGDYADADPAGVSCEPIPDGPYACTGYRLPTSAEWEYAARSGAGHQVSGGNDPDLVSWNGSNSGSVRKNVGTKAPNAWGLYDMSGNMNEWMYDARGDLPYSATPVTDPVELSENSQRAFRGGAYGSSVTGLSSYHGSQTSVGTRAVVLGFRLARTVHTNTPPEPGVWEITNDGDVVCTATTGQTDVDLDDTLTTTITFTLDEALWTGAVTTTSNPGDTIPASALTETHSVSCQVEVYDGTFRTYAESAPALVGSTSSSIAGTQSVVDLGSGEDMTFVGIPVSVFDAGCQVPRDISNCYSALAYTAELTRETWVGQTEVTQAQWAALAPLKPSPSHFDGSPGAAAGNDAPVESISAAEAMWFANELSAVDGLDACYTCSSTGGYGAGDNGAAPFCYAEVDTISTCTGYRLPTHAEWEWAARGDEATPWAGSTTSTAVGWVSGNSGGTTHQVAQLPPNAFGLFDMTGNVSEMVTDSSAPRDTVGAGLNVDPIRSRGNLAAFSTAPFRGGSYDLGDTWNRIFRENLGSTPDSSGYNFVGFRLVRVVED